MSESPVDPRSQRPGASWLGCEEISHCGFYLHFPDAFTFPSKLVFFFFTYIIWYIKHIQGPFIKHLLVIDTVLGALITQTHLNFMTLARKVGVVGRIMPQTLGDYPALPWWTHCNRRSFKAAGAVRVRERFGDATR